MKAFEKNITMENVYLVRPYYKKFMENLSKSLLDLLKTNNYVISDFATAQYLFIIEQKFFYYREFATKNIEFLEKIHGVYAWKRLNLAENDVIPTDEFIEQLYSALELKNSRGKDFLKFLIDITVDDFVDLPKYSFFVAKFGEPTEELINFFVEKGNILISETFYNAKITIIEEAVKNNNRKVILRPRKSDHESVSVFHSDSTKQNSVSCTSIKAFRKINEKGLVVVDHYETEDRKYFRDLNSIVTNYKNDFSCQLTESSIKDDFCNYINVNRFVNNFNHYTKKCQNCLKNDYTIIVSECNHKICESCYKDSKCPFRSCVKREK
jgi:hypothetical protein